MGPDDIKWHKNLEWTPLCSLIATVQPASTLFFKLNFTPTYCGADEDSSGSLDCWQFWGVPPSVNCQLLPFLHCILSIFPQWAVVSLLPSSCVILVFRRAILDCICLLIDRRETEPEESPGTLTWSVPSFIFRGEHQLLKPWGVFCSIVVCLDLDSLFVSLNDTKQSATV